MASIKQETTFDRIAIDDDYIEVGHGRAAQREVPAIPTPLPLRAASAEAASREINMADSNEVDRMVSSNGSDAAAALAADSRHLIQAIQKLESLNIKATLPSLPKIVVIGDQSAGKSSIIEAVSDITLPRSAGTCTRCPFKITTTGGDAWTCKVTLQVKYNFDPQKRRVGKPGRAFQDWTENQEIIEVPFAMVSEKQHLEMTLRRAQLAILNPDKNPNQFHYVPIDATDDSDEDQTVRFSPNVINLEICARGLPELSFYDLPGAINTFGDEKEQHLVDFVEKLLKSYVCENKALILLACAMNQDMEVSTAFRYLIECKAANRAMGVLTKPDLMEVNSQRIKNLENILSGQRSHKVGGSWFVTRQLSQQELDNRTSYGEARMKEAEFFSNGPWVSSPLSTYSRRFGIPNLQAALSTKLSAHIQADLPEIVDRVRNSLSDVSRQLASFPERAVAPSLAVIMEIDKVRGAMLEQLNADSLRSDFRKPYRDIFQNLRKKLEMLKPKVNMTTPGFRPPPISIESSDEDEEEDESPSKSRRMNNGRAMSMVRTPNQKSRASSRPHKLVGTPTTMSPNSDGDGPNTFNLDDVKNKFEAAPGADLPAQASEAVVRNLIIRTQQPWTQVTDVALKEVQQVITGTLNNAVNSALTQRQNTELYFQVGRITNELFQELYDDVKGTIYKVIAAELHRPITYDKDALRHKRGAHETDLGRQRLKKRIAEWCEYSVAGTGKLITSTEQDKRATDVNWIRANLGADEYKRECDALAYTITYYEIAAAQLVDTMAKQIECGLIAAYESRIHRKLLEDLRTTDTEYCAELLAEDPQRERQRAKLLAEQVKLEAALTELNSLPLTSST